MPNKVTDIHTHITPCVDDGSRSLEMSLQMLRREAMQGADKVFLTPHSPNVMRRGLRFVTERMEEVRKAAAEEGIPVQIFQGCEILTGRDYIEENLKDLKFGDVLAMNNTRYILVEFNIHGESMENAKYCLRRYLEEGWIPIIAHAERYYKTFATVENIRTLKEMGCLVQANYYDLAEEPNDDIRRCAQELIAAELVDMMGSDAHRMTHRKPELKWGTRYIRENCRAEYAEDLLWRNAEKLLLSRA